MVPAFETPCREEKAPANPTGKGESARVPIQVILGDPEPAGSLLDGEVLVTFPRRRFGARWVR